MFSLALRTVGQVSGTESTQWTEEPGLLLQPNGILTRLRCRQRREEGVLLGGGGRWTFFIETALDPGIPMKKSGLVFGSEWRRHRARIMLALHDRCISLLSVPVDDP
jgi:hypothetical protein